MDYIHQYRYDQWKKGTELYSIEIPSDFIEQHFEDIFNLPSAQIVLKDLEERNTPMPAAPPWEIDYGASFKNGYILVSALQPFQEAHILPRFAKVFEQAYTRYLDLKKAEAQAREAKIEAALERVRSRSMAMHHTSELQDVINTLHNQLLGLDLPITGGAFIAINEEIKDEIKCWGAGGTTDYVERVDIPFLDFPIYTGLLKGIKKGPGFFSESFSHKQKIEFFEHLLKNPPYSEVSPKRKKEIMSREGGYTRSCAVNENTSIFIINHHGVEFSEDENTILKRFASVFEQTYTRFLDLQRAEAQARESQIQLSLERVRAKAMAMRKSVELTEVLPVIFEQLDSLGVKTVWTHLTLIDLEKNTFTYRMTGRDGKRVFAEQVVDLDASSIWKNSVKSFKSQKPESIVRLYFPPESLPDIWNIFGGIFSSLPEGHKIHIEEFPGGIYTTEANCEFGYIGLNNTEKATEEEERILLRFAKEFGRLYRRFLDLQRAEAQARESQIQLSLERVRAKAMAMRKSEELTEVLPVIFEQLDSLGVKTVWTHLTLIDLEKNTFTYRMTGREGKRVFAEQVVDIDASDIWKDAAETFKSNEPDSITRLFFPQEYLPKLWEIFDGIFSSLSEGYTIQIEDFPDGLYTTQANCEFGYIGINSDRKATEEEEEILLRFANEFGRLYRRFLDLQKAEAQAREAQIQLSLERVRAKSMAMKSSDELHEILAVLFQQFDVLDIKPVNVFLSLFDKKERTLTYRASGKGGERTPSKQIIDIDSLDSWTNLFNKWEKDSSDEVEVIFYPPEIFPELFKLLDETFSKMPKKHRITPTDYPNGGYSVLGY
ncbi:MAG: hypothetical protein R3213_08560, partial [Flavobacteriaceae bacterium]|nr:hypothetical protein [Flavobacteriaceae bacterium]